MPLFGTWMETPSQHSLPVPNRMVSACVHLTYPHPSQGPFQPFPSSPVLPYPAAC